MDLVFASTMERVVSSMLYYKGWDIRDAQQYPAIVRWFEALESLDSYKASKSDYHTHVTQSARAHSYY